jgi:hypothetical protein
MSGESGISAGHDPGEVKEQAEKPFLNRSWNVQVEQVSRAGDLRSVGA